MRTQPLGTSPLHSSVIAYGCWRLAEAADPFAAVTAAYEAGYTLFDHADVYGAGEAERIFGDVLRRAPSMRKDMLLASKCGIRMAGEPAGAPYRYDFSAEYIVRSCEQSLQRLGVEMVDLYQLHRPDYLANWQEVAAAFARLREQGKVRYFGVSNFRPSQVAALQRALGEDKLIVNQVEISLSRRDCFEDGIIDQCQTEVITPLAWSPLGGGKLVGTEEEGLKLRVVLEEFATQYGVGIADLAVAWLLKHPAGIIPIVGSTQPERIRDAARAAEISLSREDWYTLLEAARGARLP